MTSTVEQPGHQTHRFVPSIRTLIRHQRGEVGVANQRLDRADEDLTAARILRFKQVAIGNPKETPT
jgi:hypothetical protein